MSRQYLRNTISVEEEKMHHGHADENSIALLMDRGSVLLHDAGYRDGLPSGPFGAWRQDYFHNRLVARLGKRDPRQSVLAYVQNSGAYRDVKTQKIDFAVLRDVDMSRTRVTDEKMGYLWDRVIAYVRPAGLFVVIDGVKALRPDYFTFANFWHAGRVLDTALHTVRFAVDSILHATFSRDRALRVVFLENTSKSISREPISRHFLTEETVTQSISSHYNTGDWEVFVTVLVPEDRRQNPGDVPRLTLVPTSHPMRAVGVRIERSGITTLLGVKLDLDMEIARENIRPRYLYELGKVRYGDVETDAHFFAVRESGPAPFISAVNLLQFHHRGATVMAALRNTHSLQLDGSGERVGFSKWRIFETAE